MRKTEAATSPDLVERAVVKAGWRLDKGGTCAFGVRKPCLRLAPGEVMLRRPKAAAWLPHSKE